jgi:hypothetical protein
MKIVAAVSPPPENKSQDGNRDVATRVREIASAMAGRSDH